MIKSGVVRRALVAAVIMVCFAAAPLEAQVPPDATDAAGETSGEAATGPAALSRPVALRLVATSCTAETARYCPDVRSLRDSPRDAAICLKVFKPSLSLPCRRAVTAAMR